ncbi:MAG: efflux RND transporter permease subunit [Gemmatimonadota bacterium]
MSEESTTGGGDGAGHGRFRDFRLTRFAVEHPTSVLVLVAIVVLYGFISYRAIPKESSPEVTIPMVSVVTVYPGVAPGDMETLVTRPIEEEINTIGDVTELTSTSREGYSNVVAEFSTEMDMEEALQQVREKVDLARPELPADAEEPTIVEYNLSEFPILQVNVSGEYDLVRLKEVAEELQERLEGIPSILEVQLSGGLTREVQIDIDLPRLKHYGVSFNDVVDAIRNENVNVPGGGIDVGAAEYIVRVDGEFDDPALIGDVVVATRGGDVAGAGGDGDVARSRPIYVRDVAEVDFGFRDRESYARMDGNPVVTLGVVKRAGQNIIETAEAVEAVVEEMRPGFPPTTAVRITADQSEEIHQMVNSLENNIISGLILVVVVLLFFLGVRNAGFVAISIPLSMLLSFIVIRSLGDTMNMVVLFSLILALGMLVDNAIVVVENIYRFMEEGYARVRAALLGTAEVAGPVIGATFTTLAAFLPLLFWPGVEGEFMGYLPRTLIITLTSSLFVALVIVPVLCSLFMRLEGTPRRPMTPVARWSAIIGAALILLASAATNPLSGVLIAVTAVGLVALNRYLLTRLARVFQTRLLPRAIERYERMLRWSLRHRGAIMGGSAGAFVGSIGLFAALNAGVEFFPEDIPPRTVYVQLDAPSGTRVDFLDRVTRRVEDEIVGLGGVRDDAESIVATVGQSGGGMGGMFGPGGDANVTVNFIEYQHRRRDIFETLRVMQNELGADLAGAAVTIEQQSMGPPGGPPVNIEIVGPDPDRLKQLADSAVRVLDASPVYDRLEGLESDMDEGRPELVVNVDRERAALHGLSTASVGNTIRSAIQGTEAATYRSGNDEYDVVVRLDERYRNDLAVLEDLTVMSRDEVPVPVSSVASWRVGEGFGAVRRLDMDRAATVSSDVRAGENSNAVLAAVQRELADFVAALPPDYEVRYTGQQEDQQAAMEFLSNAFLIALFLIAFLLVSQFNSLVKPIVILTSVIMSTVGVLLGLILFRMPFGIIMTGVGVISLAGVVVNNAIVMIDYIDQLRERDGLDRREALVRGGMTRFRPVVLTAITTVLGLTPLAIGLNFDFMGLYSALAPELYWGGEQAAWWGPMAIAVIAGLTFATVLTLILVPVMYSVVDDIALFMRRHFRREDDAGADAGARAQAAARESAAAGDDDRRPRGSEQPPEPVGAPTSWRLGRSET